MRAAQGIIHADRDKERAGCRDVIGHAAISHREEQHAEVECECPDADHGIARKTSECTMIHAREYITDAFWGAESWLSWSRVIRSPPQPDLHDPGSRSRGLLPHPGRISICEPNRDATQGYIASEG